NYFDLRKISASQNNSENKSSVGSVSGLAKAEQPQILPNHCYGIVTKLLLSGKRLDIQSLRQIKIV
ncbi:hypothetical protein, partial [uncultured Duncaniella sp.]|uniref:hypothetical protein n=1 Tax=uncultured Duncaniella sp. TaxID=2768039 RepID=UPI00272BB8D0